MRYWTRELDGVSLKDFRVSEAEIDESDQYVDEKTKEAILLARENIQKFHERQRPKDLEPEETSK